MCVNMNGIKRFSNLEIILLIMATLFGGLMLFIPIEYLFFGLIAIIALIYLFLNPKVCFYLMIISSTYIPAFSTKSQQFPFNQTDILITICFIGILLKHLFKDKPICNLRTDIDIWLAILLAIHFICGFTSISHRGYQGFLMYGETVAVFYMSLYFLRSKTIKLSNFVKVIVFTGIIQALIGIFQSVTGIGSTFQSTRGYLGLLHITSGIVNHGKGTFEHFNSLGPFLFTIFIFYFAINFFIVKNKKTGYIVLAILFFGMVTTYSRGSLMGCTGALAFFIYQIQKNKIKFLLKTMPFFAIAGIVITAIKNSTYITTISPRNDFWLLAWNSITSSPKNFFLGSGLKSSLDVIASYVPGNVLPEDINNYAPHNFILYYAIEMGIIGALAIISFLIKNFITAYKNLKSAKKLVKTFAFIICMLIIAFSIEGMFDMAINGFIMNLWFYLLLSIMYYTINQEKWG